MAAVASAGDHLGAAVSVPVSGASTGGIVFKPHPSAKRLYFGVAKRACFCRLCGDFMEQHDIRCSEEMLMDINSSTWGHFSKNIEGEEAGLPP